MGFLDMFKKNKEEKKLNQARSTIYTPEPFVLEHSDGTKDNIYFYGAEEIEGKILRRVVIANPVGEYGMENGQTYFIDPVVKKYNDGREFDITEEYYRNLGRKPEPGEDKSAYAAVKGFFKREEITKEKVGSSYIGKLSKTEQGKYYREYDRPFKDKFVAKTKENDMEKQAKKEADKLREEAEKKAIMDQGRIQEELEKQKGDPLAYDINHHRRRGCGSAK